MLKQLKALVCAVLIMLCLAGAAAAKFVILEVHVVSGFAVDVPDNLTLPSVGPGDISEDTLDVTVWANAPWMLMATMVGGEGGESGSKFECREPWGVRGNCWGLTATTVYESQQPTSADGEEVSIPPFVSRWITVTFRVITALR